MMALRSQLPAETDGQELKIGNLYEGAPQVNRPQKQSRRNSRSAPIMEALRR
jgi:hypothetical protein